MSGRAFSDRELDELFDRVGTTKRVRTDAPWGDDVQIVLPAEPPREGYVVEAMHPGAGMACAFWPVDKDEWRPSIGPPSETTGIRWPFVVAEALDQGWQLFLRKRGDEPHA